MSETAPPRVLKFDTISAVADEVRRLRHGYQQTGRWSLPQVAWHVGQAIYNCLKPVPADAVSTPEQAAMKQRLIDPLLASGVMPPGAESAAPLDPLTHADQIDEAEVDRFLEGLRDLDASSYLRVALPPFGIVSIDEFRAFIRIHAALHLSFLIPSPAPRA